MRGVVLTLLYCVVLSVCECPPKANHYQTPIRADRGALESLINTASATRESIVREELPYPAIRTELSQVYNQSSLSVEPFEDLWVNYSQNYLYIASFILFVGVVFPLVVLGLWAFWECCHVTDQEEEEEDDNRHRTVGSQLITWSLAVTVFLLLLLVCVFVSVLVAGNTLLSSGVREGSGAVGVVLPELMKVRDSALGEVEHVFKAEYSLLRRRIMEDVLSDVGPAVAANVRRATQEDVDSFYGEVLSQLQLASTLHNHTLDILSRLTSSLEDQLHPLNVSLSDLVTACEAVNGSAQLGNTSVPTACDSVTVFSDRLHFLPRQQQLQEITELRSLLSIENTGPSEELDKYLTSVLILPLNTHTQLETDNHVGPSSPFGRNLSSFLSHTLHYYNTTLTFDLPASQDQLEEYLGPRYLDNWEMARYACTLTFALIVLLLTGCLLVPIGRGLFNVMAIYRGEDELTHSEGAHQAGTTLKKVAFAFMGVCVVSSASFGLFLCVGGVLGRVCGRHGNFSTIIDNVIDHRESWGDTYPLGWALIGNNSYPLTVGSVLNSCRGNQSLYQSLQLEARLDLNELTFSEQDELNYRNAMRRFANELSDLKFHPLTPSLAALLSQLRNASTIGVQWAEFQMLANYSLLAQELSQLANSTEAVLSGVTDAEGVSNETLLAILSSTERALSEVSTYINEVISPVNASAVALEEGLATIRTSEVTEEEGSLSNSVTGISTMYSRQELSLASKRVVQEVRNYSSSAQLTLGCHTGSCLSLAALADQFSAAFCEKVVGGVDVFWSTLLVTFFFSLLVPPLCLVLAARFIDPELKETLSNKFHYWSSVVRQLRSIAWLVLSLAVHLWLVVTVSVDQFFRDRFCEGKGAGCCVECVWVMGILFLLLAAGVGVASQIYQCRIIHRIKKCAHGKVKRFWVDRKKAIQFYTQLSLLLVQDVPFLLLAGLYAAAPNTLTVPALFALVTSLTGILAYIVYLLLERGNIMGYFSWLKEFLSVGACRQGVRGDLTTGEGIGNGHANGGVPMTTTRIRGGGRYGSSESDQSDDSQGTTQQDGDWQYTTTGNHRLSNIPEQPEGSEVIHRNPPHTVHSPTSPGAVGGRSLPPPIPIPPLDDTESCSELSQAQPAGTVLLDHLDPTNKTAATVRREAPVTDGVEMAQLDFATPTNSDFGSNYSVMSEYPGYYSSQQHDEDYRDDYSDSDYSQIPSQRSGLTLHLSGVVGGVSMDV